MQLVAMAPIHGAAAVRIAAHRHEVHLDIGRGQAFAGGEERPHRRWHVGAIAAAGEHPFAQRFHLVDEFRIVVERHRLAAMPLHDHIQVILQIAADIRAVGHHLHTKLLQMRSRANAGQHEQLRAVYSAAAQDDFPAHRG